jgi:hypothetical protein
MTRTYNPLMNEKHDGNASDACVHVQAYSTGASPGGQERQKVPGTENDLLVSGSLVYMRSVERVAQG